MNPKAPPNKQIKKGSLFVGTSGWAYGGWRNFYPEDLPSRAYLSFYSGRFKTVEVNYSFYHLPKPSSYQKWYDETPGAFQFALKLSRFITHIKRLAGAKAPLELFLKNALMLKEKLGPVLVQLPPSFKADPERLGDFLKTAGHASRRLKPARPLRFVFEFRHKSWFESKDVPGLLRKYRAALAFSHSGRYPYPEKEPVTADFVYLRFHGPGELFASEYGNAGLKPWASKIPAWRRAGWDVYAYFNNDVHGYAVEDARRLLRTQRS